jgi:hypothetical protein
MGVGSSHSSKVLRARTGKSSCQLLASQLVADQLDVMIAKPGGQ